MIDNGYNFGEGDVGIVVVIDSAVGAVSVSRVSPSMSPPGTLGSVPDDRRDDARDGGRTWE